MTKPKKTTIAVRKAPRQARAKILVADVLEAAVRVLAREGARRFTTVRVAEEAGVSVGSLYQYFPNKEALLFRLQAEEWEETWGALDEILADRAVPPAERFRRTIIAFFRSEHAEAQLRVSLDDAGEMLRHTAEARALVARARKTLLAFVMEVAPQAPPARQAFAAEYLFAAMKIAEQVTSDPRTRAEVDEWAVTTAALLWGFLTGVAKERAHGRTGARGGAK